MASATSACSSAWVRLVPWCSRNQRHSRSTGLSSGECGGRNSGVIRRGHRSLGEPCHPAPSRIITACSRRLSLLAAASRIACVIFDQPVAGSTAANTQIDFRPCWRTAVGRDPSSAHTAVGVPCWPNRASSWNQMRTLVRAREARTRFTKRGRDSGRQEAAVAWATRASGQRAWLGDRGFRCGVRGGAPRVGNPRYEGQEPEPRKRVRLTCDPYQEAASRCTDHGACHTVARTSASVFWSTAPLALRA